MATPIATGAVLPRGADAVVMVEHAMVVGENQLAVQRSVAPGGNVTFAGTDVARGEMVVRKGTRLTSRETGVLAAIGRGEVSVVKRPKVAVISTGDEILAPGSPPRPAAVYDANATLLADAVREIGGEPIALGIVGDDEIALDAMPFEPVVDGDVLTVPKKPNFVMIIGQVYNPTAVAYRGGRTAALGAKIITVFPGNDATPYDSHIGVVLLFDAERGALQAIADASSITAIRTSAVSGLATRLLARPDAAELCLLGAGVLALPHLDAMCTVRPIRRVRVWSRSATRAQAFAKRARATHEMDVRVCETARDAAQGADLICTLTASRTPVLEGAWLTPGVHINAVGASMPTARELDTAAVRAARLFVDRRESALNEAGDFLIPRSEGAIDDSHIRGDLGDLLKGSTEGRAARDDITLFKSLGLAVEDVAAVRHVYEKALATGGGTPVALGGLRSLD